MSHHAIDKQVDVTLKLLITLMTEPRLNANQLAAMLDVSQNHVHRLIGRFRDAGLKIEYDHENKKYNGSFDEQLSHSVLGAYARKIKRNIGSAAFSQPPIRFVTSLERYTVKTFAEYTGVSEQNVYNAIMGSNGQHFPTGWVAYRTTDKGNWVIVKARTNRAGTAYEVPPEVARDAHMYILGDGRPLKDKTVVVENCNVPGCESLSHSRNLCSTHYRQAMRKPAEYMQYIKPKSAPRSEMVVKSKRKLKATA